MNDDELLAVMRSTLTSVKDSLTDVRLDRPASAITARARARRLRRRLTGAGAVGLTALAVGLAVVCPPAKARPGPLAPRPPRPLATMPLHPAATRPDGPSTSTWTGGRSTPRRPAWSM